jgi:soluble lytic murein transglycosylase-like protein
MPNYRALARRYAIQAGIDPDVFLRQINQESGFNPGAHSGAGAIGIAQIMPGTAAGWGVNPNDPKASLRAAAQHMAQYSKQYGGMRNALVAYNAGPGGQLPSSTEQHLRYHR